MHDPWLDFISPSPAWKAAEGTALMRIDTSRSREDFHGIYPTQR
jgi:hypothetical protein